jgi:hypothetical protein
MLPLNGTKTHPLTAHALAELLDISAKPVPRQAVSPGVANRLEREDLVAEVMLPSPFKAHKGAEIRHLRITAAGRERLGLPPEHGCGHMQRRGAA